MRKLKFLSTAVASFLIGTSSLLAQVNLINSALPKPRHGGVYVIAHRGAHNGIPENLLAELIAYLEKHKH